MKIMSVAKVIELSADSDQSFDAAVRQGVKRANDSVDNLRSVWVKDHEVLLAEDGSVDRYRVHLKATFELN